VVGSSRAASRRREEEARARRDRIVLLGTAAVLGVSAVVVLVGVYLTVYRPPREVVVTIEGRGVTAAQVVDRTSYYMMGEGGAFSTRPGEKFVDRGIDKVVRDAVLLRDAPAIVGEVTSEDIDAKIKEVVGATLEGEALTKARDEAVQRSGITIPLYRDYIKAGMLGERLAEHFKAELPASMPQRHLERVRTPSLVNAERVIERARAGEDFNALARQYGADRRIDVDQGWIPDELLVPEARAVLEGVRVGEISDVAVSGLFYDVFRVVEASDDRELTDEQQGTLSERRVDNWVKEREGTLGVTREVSDSVSDWITERVTDRVDEALRAQAAASKAKR
jgi:PPIC-type PPIASE domain